LGDIIHLLNHESSSNLNTAIVIRLTHEDHVDNVDGYRQDVEEYEYAEGEEYIATPNNHRSLIVVPRSDAYTLVTYDSNTNFMFTNYSRGLDDIEKSGQPILKTDLTIETDDMCVVCQENLNDINSEFVFLTVCNHKFCVPCITQWFKVNTKCPTCMFDHKKIYKS